MQRQGVQVREFSEPEELASGTALASYRLTAFEAEPFRLSLTEIRAEDTTLHLGRATPCLGFVAISPGSLVLHIPLENADSLVLNGAPWEPRSFGLYGAGAELLRANPRPSGFAALGLPADAAGALLEVPAGSGLPGPGACAPVRASPGAWDRAVRVVRAAGEAAAAPETFDAEQPRRALREALLHAARGLVSGAGEEPPVRVPRRSRARTRIVVAADEYLRAHLDRPIYTDELCDALGVSASGLGEAFRAVFGVSPHRFLKLRRLHMLRAALRSREGPAPLVKSIALSHGFWHLGQFAHDYRATFGEAPSETLARARG